MKTKGIVSVIIIFILIALIAWSCTSSNTDPTTYVVDVGEGATLNIRSDPSTKSPIVGSYDNGQEIIIVAISGDWAKTENGYWVCEDYLRAQ